ncbi:MAG: hypothetical protein ACI97A_001589 [Planctomycetota bacterium]|jgi:hypothetical protein
MDTIVVAYLIYIIISALLTVWVGRTLHANGRVFLMEVFQDNEEFTDSVNRLLLVGFYLINFGYISLALKSSDKVDDWRHAIELMSTKIGFVLVVLGAMHFLNLYIFSRIKKSRGPRPPRVASVTINPPKPGFSGPIDGQANPVT